MATRKSRQRNIGERIVSVDQAEPWVRILVYGPNGSGKTRFCATAPDVLIIDVNERGTRSARHSGAHVVHVNAWEDVVAAYWYLKEADHEFQSVAIDTLSATQAVCMRYVLREAAERDPNKDPKLPSKRDYGKVTELLRSQMLAFRNLPMHVIFTAQERLTGDPEEGEPLMHEPDLSAGNRGTAMGAVEIIGRLYQKEVAVGKKKRRVETRMLVGFHENYRSKDRTGNLGTIMRNPTVPEILEASFNGEE